MKLTRKSFTLVEMLLVTTLVAMVGVAIFQVFNNGLKLWARGVELNYEGDTAIMLEKMGDDLRGVVAIGNIKFSGTGMRMSFPCIVLSPADSRSSRAIEGVVDQIGAVEYSFDPGEGKVYRRQANYAQAQKGQWDIPRAVATGIEDMELMYHFAGDKGYLLKSITEGGTPAGVSVRLKPKGKASEQKRFLSIAVGG